MRVEDTAMKLGFRAKNKNHPVHYIMKADNLLLAVRGMNVSLTWGKILPMTYFDSSSIQSLQGMSTIRSPTKSATTFLGTQLSPCSHS